MKYWTLTLLFLLALSACSTGNVPDDVATISPIQVRTVSWDHGIGEFRLAFALLDGPDAAEGITAVSLNIYPIDNNDTAVWSGNATSYDNYEIPYWTAYPTVDSAGFWGVVAEMTQADGTVVNSEFIIEVEEEVGSPAIGDVPPASQNKTLATEPDLAKISSGIEPDPVFYELTVAEALENGKPTVVGFLTPGFCQTKWCAPVLESVSAVRQENSERANYIHIEVFDDFQELTYVPQMAEWGLGTQEPWVFVLDADGQVVAKFSGPLSPDELGEALRPLMP